MSRISLRWLPGLLCLLGSAAVAAKAEPAGPAKAIGELENQYSQSYVTGDVSTAERLLADDFIGFTSSGKPSDKAAVLAQVRSLPHQVSAKITSVVVRLHGDTAVALGTEDDTSAGSTDVDHRQWLDTWRHTPGGWRLVASAEIQPKR